MFDAVRLLTKRIVPRARPLNISRCNTGRNEPVITSAEETVPIIIKKVDFYSVFECDPALIAGGHFNLIDIRGIPATQQRVLRYVATHVGGWFFLQGYL